MCPGWAEGGHVDVVHAGPNEVFPSFEMTEEQELVAGELVEEQLVEEQLVEELVEVELVEEQIVEELVELEVSAGLALYMALCGGIFLLVILFLVIACMCIR